MDARSERVAKRFQWPMLVASALVVPLVILQESGPEGTWHTVARALNWGTWLAFLFELIVMLAVVPDRRAWLRKHPLELLVVVLSPPVLPAALQSVRALRLLRLIRLFRLVPASKQVLSFEGLGVAALLTFLTVIGAGAAFRAAEHGQHLSIWDGIWWAVGQMTTAGSNIYPRTNAGRGIAIIVVAVGVGFIALLTAGLAQRFLEPVIEEELGEFEREEAEAATGPGSVISGLRDVRAQLERLERDVERLTRQS